MQNMEIEREQEIRELAYQIWQEEGCPQGCDVNHWLKAQMIWEKTNRPRNKRKPSPRKGTKRKQTPTAKREL
jgi:hypothetical protein